MNSELSNSNIPFLCRACLTQSKTMVRWDCNLNTDESISIRRVLETVMAIKINNDDKYPSLMCPMCLGLLKIAYEFRNQFLKSEELLHHHFNEKFEPDNTVIIEYEEDKIHPAPVELIVGDNTYDLNNILIVENEAISKHDFTGFLQNLGKTITAKIVDKKYKYKPQNTDFEHEVVIMEQQSNQSDHLVDDCEVEEINASSGNEDQQNSSFSTCLENLDQYIIDKTVPKKETNICAPQAKAKIIGDVDLEQFIIEKNNPSKNISLLKSDDSELEHWGLENASELEKEVFKSALNVHYKCTACCKLYTTKGRFKMHLKNCGNLKMNKNVVEGEKCEVSSSSASLVCAKCKKIFVSKRQLNSHLQRMHAGSNPKQFSCSYCDHVSLSRSAAAYHKLKHGERKFSCDLCAKQFYTKNSLEIHCMNHKKIPQVLCPVCGKSFNYKTGLVYHMRIHSNERNYGCTFCDRKFYMLNSLKRHTRTHTGIRPYQCNYCEKKFFSSGEVRKHEMLHTGVRPYRCVHCKKGFTSKFNLKVHLMSHSGPQLCEICDKSFIDVQCLKFHMKTKHDLC